MRPLNKHLRPPSDNPSARTQSGFVQRASTSSTAGALGTRHFPGTCELVATMALEHALAREWSFARRTADDALAMIESLSRSHDRAARQGAACAALTLGDALLLIHEAHHAKETFDLATSFFDEVGDFPRSARARFGAAKALLLLRHPSARVLLEDAGDLFEEIGDERAVLEIESVLRAAEADFAESPRSFHASALPRRALSG